MDWSEYLWHEVDGASQALLSLRKESHALSLLLQEVERVIETRHTLLLCGNGGSAAQALHIAAELTGHFRYERPAYGVLALVENVASVTAIANDYAYASVFSRQVEAFGRPGDMLLGLTTSGNSENVLEAIRTARQQGLFTVALTGASGGRAAQMAHLAVRVPSDDTAHVQEAHLVIGHVVAAVAEEVLVRGAESRFSG